MELHYRNILARPVVFVGIGLKVDSSNTIGMNMNIMQGHLCEEITLLFCSRRNGYLFNQRVKESGQAVERASLFAKVYCTKDGHPVSTEVKDKITLRDELAQEKQRHKEEIAELHAQYKEEIAKVLVKAKRQSDAQHKE
ncbi:hypothetical protein SO802_023521 [Lithocarpus litseifolius]|uniref:Uncharacterized protein n=1 Tax=Lithocarpus litseifolius TaxID=425828 RepID=A0AAW2C753_9ROSI